MKNLKHTTALGVMAMALTGVALGAMQVPAHAESSTIREKAADAATAAKEAATSAKEAATAAKDAVTGAAATAPDDSYITLSGTVGSMVDQDEFYLNYGKGRVKVDTNDKWPNMFKPEANNVTRVLKEGDHVVVTGKVDDNWFTNREIEASSIRHQRGGQVFSYDLDPNASTMAGIDPATILDQQGRVALTGTITREVNNDRYQMRYGTGAQAKTIEVDTTGVDNAKIDNLKVGDRITVTGTVDDTLFNKRELNAQNVQTLAQTGTGASKQSKLN